MDSTKCRFCETKLEDSSRYCHNCGAKITGGGKKVGLQVVIVGLASLALFLTAWTVQGSLGGTPPKSISPQETVSQANKAFNDQSFETAALLYRSYLDINPEDQEIRSRLASTLTFLNRFEESEEELRIILNANPKDFRALAYLAINYGQMGNIEAALSLGREALENAPNEEARSRLGEFLKLLESKVSPRPATSADSGVPAEKVINYIKTNPVAGRKFDRFELDGATVKVFMREFPVDQMPAAIREKFFEGIKGASAEGSLAAVVLIDSDSGKEMARIIVE